MLLSNPKCKITCLKLMYANINNSHRFFYPFWSILSLSMSGLSEPTDEAAQYENWLGVVTSITPNEMSTFSKLIKCWAVVVVWFSLGNQFEGPSASYHCERDFCSRILKLAAIDNMYTQNANSQTYHRGQHWTKSNALTLSSSARIQFMTYRWVTRITCCESMRS